MGQKGVILALASFLFAVQVCAADEVLSHPGYLFDVNEERNNVSHEIIIMPPAESLTTVKSDVIFTQKMEREFSREFRLRFGFTEFEQLEFTSNRFVSGGDSGRLVPVDEFIEKQESFGQYMIREMAEYHVDNYLKANRKTRVVYKAKEAISNVQVEAPNGYKIKFRYRISSNRVQLNLEKKGERLQKQIDTKLDGEATTLRLAYSLTKTLRLGADYAPFDEVVALRAEKKLSPSLSTSITGQSFNKAIDGQPAQERVLLGLSWFD